MSRAEHYAEAERLLHLAGGVDGLSSHGIHVHRAITATALVHATLAGVGHRGGEVTAPEKPGRLVATRDCTAQSPQGTKCDGRVFVRTADVPGTTDGVMRRVEVARCSVCDTSPCPRCKQRTLDPTRKNCRGCGRNLSPAR